MKYFLPLLCWLLCGFLYSQQTLHVIATINPHPDDDIAVGCRKDQQNIDKLFSFVAKSLRERGSGMTVQTYTPGYDPWEVYTFLEDLTVGPDDAVFFIYSGHGLENTQSPRWPLLYYCPKGNEAADPENCGYSLHDVHEQLKAKGVRMSLTIGSSCNAEPETDAADRVVRRLGSREEEMNDLNEMAHENFGLFTNYEGHILASSALPGQLAYLNDEVGSYYVDALVNTMAAGLQARQSVSWASILRRTDRTVREEWKKEQEAQFMIFRDDVAMYSDTDHHYPGDEEDMRAIYEDEYTEEWESELDQLEALELLPYYLIASAAEQGEDDEILAHDLELAEAFYRSILVEYYPDDEDYFWDVALSDFAEDPEWFYEELEYGSDLYESLDDDLLQSINEFLLKLGQ